MDAVFIVRWQYDGSSVYASKDDCYDAVHGCSDGIYRIFMLAVFQFGAADRFIYIDHLS